MIKLSRVMLVLVGLTVSAPAFAQSKTGIVDLNRVIKDCNSCRREMQAQMDAVEKKQKAIDAQLAKLKADMQKVNRSDQAAVKRLEDAMVKQKADALEVMMEARKSLEETSQRLNGRAREVVERAATMAGVDAVFSTTEVLYQKGWVDLTAKVSDELNKKYP